jgi:hypothetical protein
MIESLLIPSEKIGRAVKRMLVADSEDKSNMF